MNAKDTTSRRPAEVFPPGDFIAEELEERGWSQQDLAAILGKPYQSINAIIRGRKEITTRTAQGLADTFGTSAQMWLNLESAYRLAGSDPPDPGVRRRARLHALAPVNELMRRGWIRKTDDPEQQEAEVCRFLEIGDIDQQPALPIAARRSDGYGELQPAQVAWAFRAKHLATAKDAPKLSPKRFKTAVPSLPRLSVDEAGMRRVLADLEGMGVRTVIVPPLPRTRIDGAMFWLNGNCPVVALSLRYDRIDSFWFTLMHELAHIHQALAKSKAGQRKGGVLDHDLMGEGAARTEEKPAYERQADELAQRWLIPPDKLHTFIERTRPFYSRKRIERFADEVNVHPGIVLGRLQHMGEVPWRNLRRMLVKASDLLAA